MSKFLNDIIDNDDWTSKTCKRCEVMQQLDYMTLEQIEKGLDHNAVQDYAYILHDKDTHDDGTPVPPHWHIMIRFKDSTPKDNICAWFGITLNYLGRIKSPRFEDALAYLIHKNEPDKYQYLEEEVKCNFDFSKEVAKAKGKGIDRARRAELVELISAGVIREYNYSDYITPQEYDKFKKSIENAFKYRADRLEGSERNMKVIYIYGESGSGKTTYAKELAAQNEYSYYVSSGSNDPLDGYKGQDCLILDDIRPNFIDVSDLLKMLDNHTGSSAKSRYRNKTLECKLVIITTSMSMELFFRSLLGDYRENFSQMKRRCELYVKMTKLTMEVRLFQPETDSYMYVGTYDNPMYGRFEIKNRSREEAREYVNNVLLSLARDKNYG